MARPQLGRHGPRRCPAPVERHGTRRVEGHRPRQGSFVPGRLGRPPLPDHSRTDRQFERRPTRRPDRTPVHGARLRAQDGSNAVGAGGTRGHPASAAPPAVRQLRLELAGHRRPARHRLFGSRGLYCYTLDGTLVWQKDFGPLRMYNNFGEGAWTVLDGNTLVVVFDHEGESFLIAVDKTTGRELWRTPRQGNTNWSGPYVTTYNGRKQVIVSASREAVGYDLETGRRLWSARGLGQNTIPAPVAADGLVFVMSGFRDPNLMAIRLGRDGDLTGTDAIVWQNQRGNSYSASPVLHDGTLYVLTDTGMLSAFDAKTGTPYYQQMRLPRPYNFKSSPVGANGKLYLASENGDVIVVKMGRTFEVLATSTLQDQVFIATPAIVDGEIYLRGENTLFCIR